MTSIFNDEHFKSIRRVAPITNASIIMCRNHICTKNYDVCSTKFESKHDWLLRLSCKVCKNEWAICTECPKFKTMMTKERQICMHRNTYHKCKHNSITQAKSFATVNQKLDVTNITLNNISTNDKDDNIPSEENKIDMYKIPVNELVTHNLNMVTTEANIADKTLDIVITPNILKYNNNMATPTSEENVMNEKVSYVLIFVLYHSQSFTKPCNFI